MLSLKISTTPRQPPACHFFKERANGPDNLAIYLCPIYNLLSLPNPFPLFIANIFKSERFSLVKCLFLINYGARVIKAVCRALNYFTFLAQEPREPHIVFKASPSPNDKKIGYNQGCSFPSFTMKNERKRN